MSFSSYHTCPERIPVWFFLTGVLLVSSCTPTRYVPEDRYLLDRYRIRVEDSEVKARELEQFVRPRPNKKVLGTRFYLGLYSLSGEKDNWINRWLRNIGEEPVLYDPFQADRNSRQLDSYMHNKGYFHATVEDSVTFKKRKARVSYEIRAGDPYTIRHVRYRLEDTTLSPLILPDTVNSLLHTGDRYDVDIMQQERDRIEERLRNRGYYNFSKDYIYFEVDSTLDSHHLDITLGIRKYVLPGEDGQLDSVPHRIYRVEKVNIYPGFDPQRAMTDYQGYIEGMNQMEYSGFHFLYEEKLRANTGIISQSIFIIPGDIYVQEKVSQSHQHLSSLRIFRLVNILFEEGESRQPGPQGAYPLVCHIQLTPATLQSATVGLEGTNSSGNIGMQGNFSYQHRNLFGGAENFRFGISGAIETLREVEKADYGNMIELGGEAGVKIPKFLLPFKTEQFIRRFHPRTGLSVAYNYQRRPDYTRSIFNTTFGYNWKGNAFTSHDVNPLQVNFVKLVDATPDFIDSIQDTYLRHSFEDRLILGTSYSFIYTNQDIQRAKDFIYFRTHFESTGLLMSGLARTLNTGKDTLDRYRLLGNEYAQYLRGEVEIRYVNFLDEKNSVVYRFFGGVAFPYGNSLTIPFEKQYFTGGANGIRAWQVRNLGPGSYRGFAGRYPNTTADIKLEANLEYRFKLFWLLEGALFVDAGNIWSITPEDERKGALFTANRFYKEIALGTGFGLRMDFSFFIFRFDLGFQLHDPSEPEGSRWLILEEGLRTPQVNIAIGYPF